MNFAAVDLLLMVVLLMSVVIGAWRGLLYEVLSLLGWIVAFVLAQWRAVEVGEWLPLGNLAEPLRYAAGFVAVFVAVAFAAGLVAWVVKKLVESVGLRPVDRTLGALFGLFRGALLLLAVTLVVSMTPVRDADLWRESTGARTLDGTLHKLRPWLPESLASYIP